jgi:enoyl-CoA hydratase
VTVVELEHVEPRIALLRLNRPEVRNALDFATVAALHDALDEVAADGECRVVVLTGAGAAFCAGLDLRNYGQPPEIGAHRHRHAGVTGQAFIANLVQHVHDTPQIVVAAVNGAAFGGGLALAAACDLRFAAESATLCSAFIRTGLSGTDVGVTYFLPRLVGAAHAFDMIVTGRTVDAAEAHRIGLVSRTFADADLLAGVLDVARAIANYTAFGLRRTKEVMWHNLQAPSLAAALALENRNQELGAVEPEVIEYMQAYGARFRQRRSAEPREVDG